MMIHMVKTVGQFALSDTTNLCVTVGVNEKGGMDYTEFEKYLLNLLISIFPYAKYLPRLIVMVNIYSGTSNSNIYLLAKTSYMLLLFLPWIS